jgi:hypothetical protein
MRLRWWPVAAAFAALVIGCNRGEVRSSEAVDVTAPSPASSSNDSTVRLAMQPDSPVAGQDVTVALHIGTDSVTPSLEDVAGNSVHLVAVSRDLSWYRHLHPRAGADGYTATLRFPSGGPYVLYTIFKPLRAPQQVRQQDFAVGSPAHFPPPRPLQTSTAPKRSGPYTVSLRTAPAVPAAGSWTSLIFHVERDGQPFASLTPTGTLGHIVILAAGGEDFVYAHSTDGEALTGIRAPLHVPANPPGVQTSHQHGGDTGPDVTFHTRFPRPGRYNVWVELNAREETIDADFTIDAGPPRLPVADESRESASQARMERWRPAGWPGGVSPPPRARSRLRVQSTSDPSREWGGTFVRAAR